MEFLAIITAFVLAWPILIGVSFSAIILLLLASEHEVFSTLLLIAFTGLVLYSFHQAGQNIDLATIAKWVGIYLFVGFVFTLPKWYIWARKLGRKYNETRNSFINGHTAKDKAFYLESYTLNKLTKDEQRIVYPNGINYTGPTIIREEGFADKLNELKNKQASFAEEARTAWDEKLRKEFENKWNSHYSKSVMKIRSDSTDNSKVEVYYEKPVLVGYLTSWIINWPFYAVLLVLEDFIVEVMNWFADRVGKTFRSIATHAFNAN